ncbi:MAG TPA: hypothetical protein VJ729_13710 [Nitrososphaeraceae archaeon]|nr:hypothetical protein [Nitrososphaeraceae archaeon]
MTSCAGWLLDVSIDNDHAILSIKTEEGQILKLRDSYHPGFYVLPRNESLFQSLSREEEISVRLEDKTSIKKLLIFDINISSEYYVILC